MRMFPPGDFDDMGGYAGELVRRAGPELDEELMAVGLFVDKKSVTAQTGPDGATVSILINTIIGRMAFSDQTQRPEAQSVDDRLEALAEQLDNDEYDARLRALDDDQ